MKKLTKSFAIKHEKLLNEENNMKEDLQLEVTKIKEKLEIFLTETNEGIRIGNKIKKGIDKLQKEKENNIIKVIAYISKLNKSQKKMNNLFKELIKNTNINFLEKENKIIYEDYYFNGIQIPKNIEVNNIGNFNVDVTWKIDEIKIENLNNNDTKFRVEIKKENPDDKFIQVYEGMNKNYKISNLESDTNYQIRINCINNNLIGNWSEVIKFKTFDNFDSIILKESGRKKEFLSKIHEWIGNKNMTLLYRGTRDGSTSNVFHNKWDNQGPTLCLYKNDKDNIFGGYASIPWTNNGGGKPAPDTFIFTLSNIYNIPPTKFNLKIDKNGVYHDPNEGPVFGNNAIYIDKDFKGKSNISYFPDNFEDNTKKGNSIFTGKEKNSNLLIKEIEVFKLD